MILLISKVEGYLIRPLVLNVLLGVLIFTLIWMAPEAFFKVVQAIQNGDIPLKEGLAVLFLQVPDIMIQALPMASLMASVFLVRRLNQDLEWVSFFALGVPWNRVIRPFIFVGLLLLGAMVFIQNVLMPLSYPTLKKMLFQYHIRSKSPISALVSLDADTTNTHPNLLLIGDIKSNHQANDLLWLEFCSQKLENGASSVKLCRWTKSGRLDISPLSTASLQNNRRVTIEAGGQVSNVDRHASLEANSFASLKPLLDVMSEEPKGQTVNVLLKARKVLRQYRQWQTLGTVDNHLWDRIATPLAVPLLMLLGIPIALEEPRKRSIQPLTLATLALFVYLVSKPLATQLASTGVIHGGIAAFFPVVLLLILYLILRRIKSV
jgi:lipopolysaccharide export LptBFGC system permease protein LptF